MARVEKFKTLMMYSIRSTDLMRSSKPTQRLCVLLINIWGSEKNVYQTACSKAPLYAH